MADRLPLGFLVRAALSDERLFDGIARALGIQVGEVSLFDVDRPGNEMVLVTTTSRPAGFRTDVSLYVDASRVRGGEALTSQELAARVAVLLGEEVLVSPPSGDPAIAVTWYLVTPDGQRFRGTEVHLGDEEDSIDIDRASLRPV
ncbi:hypothetical protein OWM54_34920 [Myxococcus sp. MISCRS1]|uniref:hypothetical protein n=1 Tax=Myxococcus TaxID=32 RepID=UPI001CBDD294|nr:MULTISPECIES: hypothetical protein [unclassified Myxococcus]MBZ4398897.1 hypothetical protein [Myxococcus sp. AS-1-15]MCY1002359.1 hypothetical protein [Myxococcus sp. MISCRS1]